MSSRRGQLPAHMTEQKPKRASRCLACICFSWKIITCVVSHVTLVLLVVSYCVGGAYLFQRLEKPHEIEVKKGIYNMRRNLTDKIWKFSDNVSVLSETDWIANVKLDLVNFEKQILTAMKTDGWDGDEDATKSQWTFAGSLFYSIIVITTIGYGHISPRTDWGKVTTIFYAIVGIPLMLLCLSNIGDVMASSFRFIYWRVCCYICTRSKRNRSRQRSRQRSMRRYPSSRSQPPPNFRRSMKMTQRSGNDSGIGTLPHAYSDPELLRTLGRGDYRDEPNDFRGSGRRHHHQQHNRSSGGRRYSPQRGGGGYDDDYNRYDDEDDFGGGGYATQTLNRSSRYSSRQRHRDQMRDRHTVERERYLSRSKQNFGSMDELPVAKRTQSMRASMRMSNTRGGAGGGGGGGGDDSNMRERERESREPRELARLNPRGRSMPARGRAKSADPRAASMAPYEKVDEELVRKTPIIPNRYAIDEQSNESHSQHQHQHHHHHHHHHQQQHQQEQQPLRGSRGSGGGPRSQSMPRNAQRGSGHRERDRERSVTPSYGGQRRSSFSRQHSAPQQRYGNRLELPEMHGGGGRRQRSRSPRPEPDYDDEYDEYLDFDDRDRDIEAGSCYEEDYDRPQSRYREPRKRRSERSERLPPSPRIMSPMGFAVKRQVRRRPSYDYDDDSYYGDGDWNDYGDLPPKDRPVPIWLCVFLVISYILGGATLFAYWESWSFLDSAYFCFITLTTIGFGDFVPAKGVQDESEQSIAYCSLYLLFGIALLAMSFNLVQEEFIANVKEVAKRLGILKDDEDDD